MVSVLPGHGEPVGLVHTDRPMEFVNHYIRMDLNAISIFPSVLLASEIDDQIAETIRVSNRVYN